MAEKNWARKPLTVEQLHAFLTKAIANGCGKKHVYLTSDDEGNDYHPAWFEPETDAEKVKGYMEYSCSGFSNCLDPDNAIII